jgi:hypothetical protein
MNRLQEIQLLVKRITMNCMGVEFVPIVAEDKVHGGRIYVQVEYETKCTHTNSLEKWKGRKYYLSDYMTDDEVVKTCYVAFETAVKHETMEGFKVDNIILFNPHVNFEELLKVSHKEIKRT